MGAALYIILDAEEPGFETGVDGKILSQNSEALDRFATELGVTPLMSFFSVDPRGNDVRDFFDDEDEIDPELLQPPEVTWFAPEDGLKTVRSLLGHVEGHPQEWHRTDDLISDLRRFEDILSRAADAGHRWHLAVDY
jgi:hypothetical protein